MKFTFTILFLTFFIGLNGFAQEPVFQLNELETSRIVVLTVSKPGNLGSLTNPGMYGVLGPESFQNDLIFDLTDPVEIRKYGASIYITLNDTEINTINSINATCIRLTVIERDCMLDDTFYKRYEFVGAMPAICTDASSNSSLQLNFESKPLNDIFPALLSLTGEFGEYISAKPKFLLFNMLVS